MGDAAQIFAERGLVPRRAAASVERALAEARVVLVNGARQAGKSTLVQVVAAQRPGTTIQSLDDLDLLAAAKADPKSFVEADGLLVIDEIQRAPELLLAIKLEVDTRPSPGRFLITGSSRVLGMRSVPDTLPGRVEVIELWPFSQGELDAAPDGFVAAMFSRGEAVRHTSTVTRRDLAQRLLRGGLPEAVERPSPGSRRRFLIDYVASLVDREITAVGEIEKLDELRKLLRLLAARSAQLLVVDPLARDAGLSASTVRRYLGLLEEIFVIKRVPAWSRNFTTRAAAVPKSFFVDSAVPAALLAQDVPSLLEPTSQLFGSLVEGFVAAELLRQISWSDEPVELYHFHTRDQIEVDLVLEHARGAIVGIEVKAAATVRSDDFRGLRHLQARAGDAFHLGVVLYSATQTLSFGPKLLAMPLSAVWQLDAA